MPLCASGASARRAPPPTAARRAGRALRRLGAARGSPGGGGGAEGQDAGVFGFYSVIKRSPLGPMADSKKLEFLETPVGKWLNRFTVWELDKLGEYKVVKCRERTTPVRMREATEEVERRIQSEPVVMYSFTVCPWCIKAKDELDRRGIGYWSTELDTLGDEGPALQAALGVLTGRTSMPCIFIGGKCVGGAMDGTPGLLPLIERGGLEDAVVAAGGVFVDSTSK